MTIENPRVDGSIPPLATNYPIEKKQKSVIPLADTCGQTPRAAAMPEGSRRSRLHPEPVMPGRKSPSFQQHRNPERSGPFRVSRMCTRRPLRQSSIACYRPSTTDWLLTPWRAAVSGQSANSDFRGGCQVIGHCCRWRWLCSMAGVVQVTDVDAVLCLNGRFHQRRGTAPEPFRPVSFLHGCRPAKPMFCELEFYKVVPAKQPHTA